MGADMALLMVIIFLVSGYIGWLIADGAINRSVDRALAVREWRKTNKIAAKEKTDD